jgi:aromatic-L-amino-acid decarboxylase
VALGAPATQRRHVERLWTLLREAHDWLANDFAEAAATAEAAAAEARAARAAAAAEAQAAQEVEAAPEAEPADPVEFSTVPKAVEAERDEETSAVE